MCNERPILGGCQKGGFPKGWFWRMFPRNENWNEGTFGCSPGTKPERGYLHMLPRNEKPEQGYVRQNHPLRNRPFVSSRYSSFVILFLFGDPWGGGPLRHCNQQGWLGSVPLYFQRLWQHHQQMTKGFGTHPSCHGNTSSWNVRRFIEDLLNVLFPDIWH